MYRWLGWGLLIAATLRVLLVDIHNAGGRAVVWNLVVVGSITLVAAFSDRALFARIGSEPATDLSRLNRRQ